MRKLTESRESRSSAISLRSIGLTTSSSLRSLEGDLLEMVDPFYWELNKMDADFEGFELSDDVEDDFSEELALTSPPQEWCVYFIIYSLDWFEGASNHRRRTWGCWGGSIPPWIRRWPIDAIQNLRSSPPGTPKLSLDFEKFGAPVSYGPYSCQNCWVVVLTGSTVLKVKCNKIFGNKSSVYRWGHGFSATHF